MSAIIVPLDGSPLSERALPLACTLAREMDLTLVLLHVHEPEPSFNNGRDAQAALHAAYWHVRRQYGLDPETQSRCGYVGPTIADEVRERDAWAVVMASHSRAGLLRSVLGSVAEEVIDLSPVPVFLIPASVDAPGLPRFRRILVPLNGSSRAEAVLAPLRRLTEAFGAEVLLFHVFEPVPEPERATYKMLSAVGQVVDGLTPGEIDSTKAHEPRRPVMVQRITLGEPAREIVEVCGREQVDLVAFATHGRTPLDREHMSTVGEAVLRRSHVPLMVLGREALRRLGHEPAHPAADERAAPRKVLAHVAGEPEIVAMSH